MKNPEEPTIIRSNAPHTVEVTPGSLNAKGKKNIVSSEENELNTKQKILEKKESTDDKTLFGKAENIGSVDLIKIDDTHLPKSNDQLIEHDEIKNNNIKIQPTDNTINNQQITTSENLKNNLQIMVDSNTTINKQLIQNTSENFNNLSIIENSESLDNTLKIQAKNIEDNLQPVNNEKRSDNNINLTHDLNKYNSVKILDDKESSIYQQIISMDIEQNNTVALSLERPTDNIISVNEKVGVVDNNQTINPDDQNKNIQPIEVNNISAESSLSEYNNLEKIEADLNFSDKTLKDTIKPKKQLTLFERNQLIQKQMLLVEEKRKKDEAYSGRVNEIKKQVVVLNQQLDKLENTKPNNLK